MRIAQILAEKPTIPVERIHPTTDLRRTAQKLLCHGIGALVVTDDANTLCGIVSERDLVQIVANFDEAQVMRPVSDVMTRDVITCTSTDEVAFVLNLMTKKFIRHMPVVDDGVLVNMVSIRELNRAYELLQIEANTDPLTELSNRRPFLRTLDDEFARAKRFKHPLSVAMIDLDHFKLVNDTYGHDSGDVVLRQVSAQLVHQFRSIDLIGRLGGEEFAVVFPETDLSGARLACDRLRQVIETSPITVDGNVINITASIGVASKFEDTVDGPAILKRADELLYLAKNGGRNRVAAQNE